MTGTKLYHFDVLLEKRTASASALLCSGEADPDGDSHTFYARKKVKKHYDNGDITYTTDYDLRIVSNAGTCSAPVETNDAVPGFNYGTYHSGADEVTYEGATVTTDDVKDQAKADAASALSGASWSTSLLSAGGTFAAAWGAQTDSNRGSGPILFYTDTTADAGAQEYRVTLRAPFIPCRVVFTVNGSETTHNLDGTSLTASFTPPWKSGASGDTDNVFVRFHHRPYT